MYNCIHERGISMDNAFYLLSLSLSGVKSIKNLIKIDFYQKTIDKNFNPDRFRVKAIYGENGAGKSAIVTAVKIFQDMMTSDMYFSDGKNQAFLDEIVNKKTRKFHFECEFIARIPDNFSVYKYIVEVEKNSDEKFEIASEQLYMKNGNYPNNSYKLVFGSNQGMLTGIACDEGKDLVKEKTANLLKMSSFVQLFLGVFTIDDKIDKGFAANILLCLVFAISIKVYLGREDQHDIYFIKRRFNNLNLNDSSAQELDNLLESVQRYVGVNESLVSKENFARYEGKIAQLTEFIKIFKKDLQTIDIDAKENGNQYVCTLNLNYGTYSINREFESTGVKKLISLFDSFVAAGDGFIVFIDEMDSNLNDIYLCKLVEYFMYYAKGQLCFTTHNLDPMHVLKENKMAIDFLSSDNIVVPWTTSGNASPYNSYRNGMIKNSPFNVDATDFVGILGN